MSKVLLVSDGGLYLALRLPLLIQRAGWDVDLLCLDDDPVRHSRYIREVFTEKTLEALILRAQRILDDRRRPWAAVIITHEGVVRRIINNGNDDMLMGWQPGATNPEVREFLVSKFGLAGASKSQHFNIPASLVCNGISDIAAFGDQVGWPIIVKPPDFSGGAGVEKLDSENHLKSRHKAIEFPVLAQKFIHGRHGVVDMLCSKGRPLAWLSSYSLRRYGGEFKPSTARLFRAMPKLQSMVEELARFTQFEGFCGFDWIEENATGTHYLIEFHPRAPSGFRFGRYCNVDFPSAISAWLNKESGSFSTIVQREGNPIEAYYFAIDLLRCFRHRDWDGLTKWIPRPGLCHDIYWDDWPMMIRRTGTIFLRGFKRLFLGLERK